MDSHRVGTLHYKISAALAKVKTFFRRIRHVSVTTDAEHTGNSKRASHRIETRPDTSPQPGIESQDRVVPGELIDDSACKFVMKIPELLENILSFLPPRKIFILQRVCKDWKKASAKCPGIQEKLFFRLQDKPPEVWELLDAGSNNIYRRYHDSSFRTATRSILPADHEGRRILPVALSPVLSALGCMADELQKQGRISCDPVIELVVYLENQDALMIVPSTAERTLAATWQRPISNA